MQSEHHRWHRCPINVKSKRIVFNRCMMSRLEQAGTHINQSPHFRHRSGITRFGRMRWQCRYIFIRLGNQLHRKYKNSLVWIGCSILFFHIKVKAFLELILIRPWNLVSGQDWQYRLSPELSSSVGRKPKGNGMYHFVVKFFPADFSVNHRFTDNSESDCVKWELILLIFRLNLDTSRFISERIKSHL